MALTRPSPAWGENGSRGLFVEVAWTRQESRVSFDDAFGEGLDEVSLDTFLVGGQWDAAPRAVVRPSHSFHVGATRIEAPGGLLVAF